MDADRLITAARAVALASPGTGRGLRVGAVLAHKGRVVAARFNENKTHPRLAKLTVFPFLHAESRVLLHHGLDNCAGLTLAVARVFKDGSLALAKPCDICSALIEEARVRRVYYTDDAGEVQWYRV